MAELVPDEYITNGNIYILGKKYITFGDITLPIFPYSKSVTKNAYELLGCIFPSVEGKEPGWEDNITVIKSYLKDNKSINVVNVDNTKITTITRKHQTTYLYRAMNGEVYDLSDNSLGTINGYFPTKIGNANDIYYIHEKKVWIINKSTNGYKLKEQVSDDDISPADVPKSNDQIMLSNVTGGATFNDKDIDQQQIRDGVISVNIEFTINYSIYLILLRSNGSISTDITDTSTLCNYIFLQDGLADFQDNSLLMPDTDSYKTYMSQTATSARSSAVSSKEGIWSLEYWTRKLKDNDFPVRTSYSALGTFMACPYRYFVTVVNNNRYVSRDKSELMEIGSTKGANIIGDIIHHYCGGVLFPYIVNNGKSTTEQVQNIKDIAIRNWLGTGLDKTDFQFTRDDINKISDENKKEGIKAINDSLDNINNRDYLNAYDSFVSELYVSNIYYDSLDTSFDPELIKRRFNITGYIDGTAYSHDNDGDNWKLSLFDFKSSRMINAFDKRIPNKFTMDSESGKKDLGQVVFYLYCFYQLGEVIIGEHSLNLRSKYSSFEECLVDLTHINLFFDMTRYSNGTSVSIIEVNNADDRLSLWDKIKSNLDNIANLLEQYENTPNTIDKIPTKYNPEICKFCEVQATCPEFKSKREEANLHNKDISKRNLSLPITITEISRTEDEISEEYLTEYFEAAKNGVVSAKLMKLSEKLKNQYKERRRKIRAIENEFNTQIGAIYLTSPIISISTVDTKRHVQNDVLRAPQPSVMRSQGSSKDITFTIRFPSQDAINTEMRHILAQYQAFPFFSIRNPDITRIALPFDVNKDVYVMMRESEVANAVDEYLNVKGDNNEIDVYNMDESSSSYKKNKIYEKARLFYSVESIILSPTPNLVDTIDMILRIRLIDTSSVSIKGTIEYLQHTHATMLQHAWLYNNNTEVINNSPVSKALLKAFNTPIVKPKSNQTAQSSLVLSPNPYLIKIANIIKSPSGEFNITAPPIAENKPYEKLQALIDIDRKLYDLYNIKIDEKILGVIIEKKEFIIPSYAIEITNRNQSNKDINTNIIAAALTSDKINNVNQIIQQIENKPVSDIPEIIRIAVEKQGVNFPQTQTYNIVINFVEAAEVTQARLANNSEILTDEEAKELEQKIKDEELKLQEIEKQIKAAKAEQN